VSRAGVSTLQENIFDDANDTTARPAARTTSSQKPGLLGVRVDPGESISTRLASLRMKETRVASGSSVRSDIPRNSSNSSLGTKNQQSSLKRAPSTISVSSSKTRDTARSKTPANEGEDTHTDLSSPDLPMDPVTPVSNAKIQSAKVAVGAERVKVKTGTGRTRAESASRGLDVRGAAKSTESKDKGKDREVDVEADHDTDEEGAAQQAREHQFSMQVSPRRPTAPTWVSSPIRPNTFSMQSSANGAYEVFRGLIADMQDKNHADIKALHIDMLRMGRGLRQEMEEWGGEVRKLREENAKLREENDRLRGVY
jgi:protein NEDD1